MLNCPFCEFKNAASRRTCEQCGKPLQRWRVIDLPGSEAAQKSLTPAIVSGSYAYLDADQRYRLIDAPGGMTDLEATPLIVLDCQPEAGSPLQALQQAWLDNPALDPTSEPPAAAVPAAAYPYMALQADHFPAVPDLHHAWQTGDRTLLLIEDRSSWLSLATGWSAIGDPLQHIQWLFETTLLWQALAPWQAQATVLNPQRLVLNENSLLCLTQLDQRAQRSPLPLSELGQMWQGLMSHSADSAPPSLQDLVDVLVKGTVLNINHLQDSLAEMAQAYQEPLHDLPDVAWADSQAGDDSLELESDIPIHDLESDAFFDTQEIVEDESGGGIEAPTMVLPMKLAHLDDAGQSHVGQQRHHNEDWFFTQAQLHKVSGPQGTVLRSKGLYILCDGMGGHASGEVASQLAVRTLRDFLAQHWGDHLPDQAALAKAVVTANEAIFNINQSNATSGVGRMGTTLVMVLVHNLDIAVVHVGDSRLYAYSKRLGLRQLTLDHEVGQREINRGVEPALAYARPDAYQLTQALGPRSQEDLFPSVAYHEITEDTLLLLCSDGLSDNGLLERHVDSHIAGLLSSRANLESGVAQLIDLANEENGHDNITTVLVRIKLQPDMTSLIG